MASLFETMLLIGIQISNFKNLCPRVGPEYPHRTIRQGVSNVIIAGIQKAYTFPSTICMLSNSSGPWPDRLTNLELSEIRSSGLDLWVPVALMSSCLRCLVREAECTVTPGLRALRVHCLCV